MPLRHQVVLSLCFVAGSFLCGSANAQTARRPVANSATRAAATDLSRPGASTLKKYAAPAAQSRALAAKLSLQFRDVPGLSIVPDPSRGELVVMAPANLHGDIQSALSTLLSIETPTQRVRIGLKHITGYDFESLLHQLAGRPLPTHVRGGGNLVSINLQTLGLPATSIDIDRGRSQLIIDSPAEQTEAWRRVITAIDAAPTPQQMVQIVRIVRSTPAPIQRAVRLLAEARRRSVQTDSGLSDWNRRQAAKGRRVPIRPVAFKPQDGDGGGQQLGGAGNENAAANPAGNATNDAEDTARGAAAGGLGDVQIEFVPEIGQAIIRGSKKDVERVKSVIEEIERQSEITKPDVEVVTLRNVDSQALAALLKEIYDDVLSARQGEVSVTALDNPNALLLIGRTEAIRSLLDLIRKLDQPSDDTGRLRVFRLQHASAIDAETKIREFFVNRPGSDDEDRPGLGTRVRVSADYRTNSLIVNASPRDLEEVARLINELDVLDIPAESQLKVFQLNNALAEDLAEVINDAIAGETEAVSDEITTPSTTLSILSIDPESGGLLQSGILSGAVVTADPNSNQLVVRAPSTAMPLVTELVRQLDQPPGAESLVKVFTIENGDALALTAALQDLFGEDAATNGTSVGAANLAGLPSSTAGADSSLVGLRFSTDQRTNSIIASGSADDLDIVESILLRLDTEGFAERITEVIWLRHQSAESIATALQTYIQQRVQTVNTIQQFQQGLGVFDLPDRDLIVVAEPVTNSLLLSVAPRLYEDVRRLIDQLDRRPPMVLIKTLIAEVTLNDGFEIGGELGLQDSLLFDRSIAAEAVDTAGTATLGNTSPSGGFNFNSAAANANQNNAGNGSLAARSLSTFGLGTVSDTFGFGGFVLSAASESVSLLFRALQNANRLQILSRPQVMALDNTEAFLQVGRQIARITGVVQNGLGNSTLDIEDIEVGLILRVRPRVGSDGLILVDVDATRSERDPASGTTIPTGDADGSTVTIDDITRTTAQSTIAAYSGQTVIFGGLIQKERVNVSRRVPYLADVPFLGYLFKFDLETERRSETLIVLTPTLVLGDEDLEYIKQVESSRMSWCLADVVEMHGDVGLSGGYGLWGPVGCCTIYPDTHPTVDQFDGVAGDGGGDGCRDGSCTSVSHGGNPVFAPEIVHVGETTLTSPTILDTRGEAYPAGEIHPAGELNLPATVSPALLPRLPSAGGPDPYAPTDTDYGFLVDPDDLSPKDSLRIDAVPYEDIEPILTPPAGIDPMQLDIPR